MTLTLLRIGKIKELQFRSSIDVWGYFSVDHSGLVHEFADSQFGHIFASGRDRESARRAMIVALKELQIRGEIRTTIEYIVKMLQSEDFVKNRIDTMWLDARLARHKELAMEEYALYEPPVTLVATAGAALKGYQLFKQRGIDFIRMLASGHVPAKDILSPTAHVDLIFNNVKYVTTTVLVGPNNVTVASNGSDQHIQIRELADEGYLLDIDGKSHLVYSMAQSGGSMRMILDNQTCIFTPEYDPTKLTSSVAGKLARLLVPDGSHVNAGDPFVEIEVMKMYMPLKALESGTVYFQMSEGAALSVGDLIATVVLDDPDTVIKAEVYTGRLDAYQGKECAYPLEEDYDDSSKSATTLETNYELKPHIISRKARQKIENVLDGYFLSDVEIRESFAVIRNSFDNKLLPAFEVEDALSVLRGRIDADLYKRILDLIHGYVSKVKNNANADFPASDILLSINSFASSLPMDKRIVFNTQMAQVWSRTELYLYSAEVRALGTFLKYIETFLNVEKVFDMMSFTDVVGELRKENGNDLNKVLSLCRSHANLTSKLVLLLCILEEIKSYPLSTIMKQIPRLPNGITIRNDINLRNFKVKLTSLSQLRMGVYSHIAYAANLMVIEHYSESTEARRQKVDDAIVAVLTSHNANQSSEPSNHLKKLIDSNIIIRDLIIEALQRDLDYQMVAMELYIRKIYNKTHRITNIAAGQLDASDAGYDFSSNGSSNGNYPYLKFEFITKSFETTTDGSASPVLSEGDKLSPTSSKLNMKKNISFTDLETITRSTSIPKMSRMESFDNLTHPIVPGLRIGVFVKIDSLVNLSQIFPNIADLIPLADVSNGKSPALVNGIHVAVIDGWDDETTDDQGALQLSNYLTTQADNLRARGIRRVTFFVGVKSFTSPRHRHENFPASKVSIFTFRARLGFAEDRLFRHIEAPHAFHLELPRLSNFSITLEDGIKNNAGNVQGHLYRAVPKGSVGPVRYFARLVSFADDILNGDVESLFLGALDNLSFVIGREEALSKNFKANAAANHIFVNIANPDTVVKPSALEADLKRMWEKHWYKLVRLAVTTVEFKISCRLSQDGESVSLRFVATNPTGFVIKAHLYYEALGYENVSIFRSVGEVEGPWDGMPINTPYPVTQPFEKQRAEAMLASDTLYVYDWPILFEGAIEKQWLEYKVGSSVESSQLNNMDISLSSIIPKDMIKFEELVVCNKSGEVLSKYNAQDINDGVLHPMIRDAGLNIAGMVAWLVTMKTPDYPDGRSFVLIANDITNFAGSFGTKEDYYFYKV